MTARACTREEVEATVVRSHYGPDDLVPVIFEPQGKVELVPRKVIDLLKRVRKLTPAQRADFDKVMKAAAKEMGVAT